MKRVLVGVCMVVAFMAVAMMSGCTTTKPMTGITGGGEGAAKPGIQWPQPK